MTTAEKKEQAIRYIAEIESPITLDRIYRYIYRQFLKPERKEKKA